MSTLHCAILAQFRSGHSVHLCLFAHDTGLALDGICTRCGDQDEDVPHIFDYPTALTTLSPIHVANFLKEHLYFSSLSFPLPPSPPLEPPPPF